MTAARTVAVMALAQFLQFVVLTGNFRAIAAGMYAEAGATAALASVLGYVITKRIAESKDLWGLLGLTLGGAAADMVGIYLTRSWQ